MEQFAQQLKGNGIDLAWWPLLLGSYQDEVRENWAVARTQRIVETPDFEETLP